MATREGSGTKIVRGVLIAVGTIGALVLLVALWDDVVDALARGWGFIADHFPTDPNQRVAVIVYLVIAVLIGVVFSRAGHFTAYGVAVGLGPLLWALFWEGFPPLGLSPAWTDGLGVGHLSPTDVIIWAVVADVLITLVFVPLELLEKRSRRRRRRSDDD